MPAQLIQTFNTPTEATAFTQKLGVMPVAYGRFANRERSFTVEHDALCLFDVTWRVYEVDCPEDRAWFAKHGHKAWVKRSLSYFKRTGR